MLWATVQSAGEAQVLAIEQKYIEFRAVHDALPGHHGVEKTLEKLKAHLAATGRPLGKEFALMSKHSSVNAHVVRR